MTLGHEACDLALLQVGHASFGVSSGSISRFRHGAEIAGPEQEQAGQGQQGAKSWREGLEGGYLEAEEEEGHGRQRWRGCHQLYQEVWPKDGGECGCQGPGGR